MAGGTFETFNKVRPGFYARFEGVPTPLTSVGTRGIVAIPVPLGWTTGVTEVFSTDLVDGSVEQKLGYSTFSPELQLVRLALKNAYKALVYRIDVGGEKASATISELGVVAQHAGVIGNEIQIVTQTEPDGRITVETYFKAMLKDTQTVSDLSELLDNDFVQLDGTGTVLSESAGTFLAGGTNGTITNENYTGFFAAIRSKKFNTLAIPSADPSLVPLTLSFVENLREEVGKKVQAVVYNSAQDYEGIISTMGQGYIDEVETVSPIAFVAYMGGLSAGANINESNTYHVIRNAHTIINPLSDEEIKEAILKGFIILSEREDDGAIVVETDINTLITYGNYKNKSFSKNRTVRVLDEIYNTCRAIFERQYIGKVDNDPIGRNVYKADLLNYLNQLQGMRAIKNFDSTTDVEVVEGQQEDEVIINMHIQPNDSMEKAYMFVKVGRKQTAQ